MSKFIFKEQTKHLHLINKSSKAFKKIKINKIKTFNESQRERKKKTGRMSLSFSPCINTFVLYFAETERRYLLQHYVVQLKSIASRIEQKLTNGRLTYCQSQSRRGSCFAKVMHGIHFFPWIERNSFPGSGKAPIKHHWIRRDNLGQLFQFYMRIMVSILQFKFRYRGISFPREQQIESVVLYFKCVLLGFKGTSRMYKRIIHEHISLD